LIPVPTSERYRTNTNVENPGIIPFSRSFANWLSRFETPETLEILERLEWAEDGLPVAWPARQGIQTAGIDVLAWSDDPDAA
jgi:hypothetical protein